MNTEYSSSTSCFTFPICFFFLHSIPILAWNCYHFCTSKWNQTPLISSKKSNETAIDHLFFKLFSLVLVEIYWCNCIWFYYSSVVCDWWILSKWVRLHFFKPSSIWSETIGTSELIAAFSQTLWYECFVTNRMQNITVTECRIYSTFVHIDTYMNMLTKP